MTIIDILVVGSAFFWLGLFASPMRDAWYNAYYNDDGTPKDWV